MDYAVNDHGELVEEVVNIEQHTEKVTEREYVRDMNGKKISYTDRIHYIPKTTKTSKNKYECKNCGYFVWEQYKEKSI